MHIIPFSKRAIKIDPNVRLKHLTGAACILAHWTAPLANHSRVTNNWECCHVIDQLSDYRIREA